MEKVKTLYDPIDRGLFEQLKNIKLLLCDVDGVFSDGRIYLGNKGEELKAFHTRDGYGIKALGKIGISVAVITGRQSAIVQHRMEALNVPHIIQGCEEKESAAHTLVSQLNLSQNEVAAIGDDMPDLGMFANAAVRIAVADAHPLVKHNANWVTSIRGGFGAVREVCDTLLQANDKLHAIHGASV
ncbi:3-deoxy-manno-octulosonate-8-phosphatase KdsC [Alteromonas ponticola]|uniref:3-deoxy-D-manno-octulosonate 8-phosphate phosphatase KdsC n=1 Tax=Alteromonas aquimaris TaxID=2998417 RepID=A0ABT3PBI7_9ALTE|nr:3-deoxy-manno-octulosonate-8-phosphatase KdsC [Alteromonas aquimaris]MCW8109456.1 3-deoxy-manno-octulosonate-8-phosphatase KdsC [Alteromonas aquimaris]